jgi:hypothetical protein
MAYKINYHGYDVTCETVADLQALVSQNGNGSERPKVVRREIAAVPEKGSEGTRITGFIAKLPKEQRNLIRIVAQAHGTVPRDRLRELVGVSDTHKFAGLMISLSKFAEGAGVKSPL